MKHLIALALALALIGPPAAGAAAEYVLTARRRLGVQQIDHSLEEN